MNTNLSDPTSLTGGESLTQPKHSEQPEHAPHGLSTRLCVIVWAALMSLTAITVAVSEFDLGAFHILVAMLVATIKAGLVVLWFMHLKYEGAAIRLMVFIAFFILAIAISFTFFDVAYR